MKKHFKFLIALHLIGLIGCVPTTDDEIEEVPIEEGTTEDPFSVNAKIRMAWLKENGTISDSPTTAFLMVDEEGIEKSLLKDNYLVSIVDSANVQSHSISFFDSITAYVPSRIVSDDLELVISNFDDATFSFDMNIIYPSEKYEFDFENPGKKSLKQGKKVVRIENQQLDPEVASSLKKLKEYTFGEGTLEGSVKTASYLNTLRIGLNDAFKAGKFKLLYENAVKQLEQGSSTAFNLLNNNKEFKRFKGYNWKTNILKGITTSIAENIVTNSDWFGTYNAEISLAFSGAFAIAGCVATLGVGCAIGVLDFGIDAYNYYLENFIPTHIGIMRYTFQGTDDACGCGNTTMTVDFGNGETQTIANGTTAKVALEAGTYDLKLSFTTSQGEIRTERLVVNSDNFSISWFCFCTNGTRNGKMNVFISKI